MRRRLCLALRVPQLISRGGAARRPGEAGRTDRHSDSSQVLHEIQRRTANAEVVMRKIEHVIVLLIFACSPTFAQRNYSAQPDWPHPIPARINDHGNRQLLIMTLGDVTTPLADGVFDPVKDELRLKDGTTIKNYYRDTLKIRYFAPIDKSSFPLPPSGWCSWYFYYQEIIEGEMKLIANWISEDLKDFGVR